jgi:hypothetical protein
MAATFTKQILKAGSGATPQAKQNVTVSADLYLAGSMQGIWSTHKPSGFLFSAQSGPQPFTYVSGVGSVVRGWYIYLTYFCREDGVASMQMGESARLSIPWEYAYGADGHPGFKIGTKADLIFDIEILKIA